MNADTVQRHRKHAVAQPSIRPSCACICASRCCGNSSAKRKHCAKHCSSFACLAKPQREHCTGTAGPTQGVCRKEALHRPTLEAPSSIPRNTDQSSPHGCTLQPSLHPRLGWRPLPICAGPQCGLQGRTISYPAHRPGRATSLIPCALAAPSRQRLKTSAGSCAHRSVGSRAQCMWCCLLCEIIKGTPAHRPLLRGKPAWLLQI